MYISGVDIPPLKYKLSSIYILLTGPTENYKSTGGYYGFKCTVYPSGRFFSSTSDSVLKNNNADAYGGVYLLKCIHNYIQILIHAHIYSCILLVRAHM